MTAGLDIGLTADERRHVVPARYWTRLESGKLRCDVCPRFCKLRDGQRGLCFVRARQGDSLVLTTYGRSSGFCVDPIEKKPLNHFLARYSGAVLRNRRLQPGLRSFCQNWDISKSREIDTLAPEAPRPEAASPAAQRGPQSCRSVALPTTIRSSFWSTPSTWPRHATGAVSKPWR